MNFDFGEVLSRAWQITWKQRVLWVIGILFGLFVSLMFPLMFSPLLFPILAQNSRMDLAPVVLVGFILAFILFMLVLYPISVLAQTSLTLGVLDVEQKDEGLSVRELLQRSLPYFWRVLGLMLLFAAGLMLIVFIVQIIALLLMVLTLGVGAICITPLSILMYPVIYGATVWMEQSMNGIIVDNLTVMEAARQGWNLLRNNALSLAVMALIIYLGVGMITGIVVMPLMFPIFMVPFGFLDHEANRIFLSVAIACAVAFIPLFAVLSGWSAIFTKSAWVLTYLRLTRNPGAQPLPQQATA